MKYVLTFGVIALFASSAFAECNDSWVYRCVSSSKQYQISVHACGHTFDRILQLTRAGGKIDRNAITHPEKPTQQWYGNGIVAFEYYIEDIEDDPNTDARTLSVEFTQKDGKGVITEATEDPSMPEANTFPHSEAVSCKKESQ